MSTTTDTKTCTIDGCDSDAIGRGWCKKHYNRWYRHGDPVVTLRSAPGTCTVDGCSHKVKAREMCSSHYEAWRKTNPAEVRPMAPRFARRTSDESPLRLAGRWVFNPRTRIYDYQESA